MKNLKLLQFPENIRKSFLDIFEKASVTTIIPYNKGRREGIEDINEALDYGKRNKDYFKLKDESFSKKFKDDSSSLRPIYESNDFLSKDEKRNLKNNKNLGILSDESVASIIDKVKKAVSSPAYINHIAKILDDNSAMIIMPSSSGKNIIPSVLAQGIKSKIKEIKGIDIPIISNFAKPEHFSPAEDKIGIDSLIDPISWKINESILNKHPDKKMFIVDDIYDSGESGKALFDKLKRFNVQKKIINLGVGDNHGLKSNKQDILFIIDKIQEAFPEIRPQEIHDAIHYNIGGKSPEFIKRFMKIDFNNGNILKSQKKHLLELIKDFKNKETSWQKDFKQQ